MINNQFQDCQIRMQEIIDLVLSKQIDEANIKISLLTDTLNEMIDVSDNDEDIMKISKYQVLLKQLFGKNNIK